MVPRLGACLTCCWGTISKVNLFPKLNKWQVVYLEDHIFMEAYSFFPTIVPVYNATAHDLSDV